MLVVALSTFGLLAAQSATVSPGAEARAVECARGFYSTHKGMPSYGLPAPAEMAKLAPFLSARLLRLLRDARRYQTAFARQHPGDKPPFVDGDLFSSNFEGFSDFAIGSPKAEPTCVRVPIALRYESAAWRDVAVIVREGDKYVIDDFEFGADWPFGNHGTLSTMLRYRP